MAFCRELAGQGISRAETRLCNNKNANLFSTTTTSTITFIQGSRFAILLGNFICSNLVSPYLHGSLIDQNMAAINKPVAIKLISDII